MRVSPIYKKLRFQNFQETKKKKDFERTKHFKTVEAKSGTEFWLGQMKDV